MRHIHQIGNAVEFFLPQRRIVDHNGIVEVAALDQIAFNKRFDLTHKHECAA